MTSQRSKHPDWDEVWQKVQNRDRDWLYEYTKSHDINQCTDEQGNTLLHCAVHGENLRDIVELSHFLIDPNIKNVAGQTALQLAQDTDPRCLKRLPRHHLCIDFDKASLEPNGLDALFAAIYRGDTTLGDTSGVKSDGDEKNEGGWTALHCAAVYGRPHLIRALHQRFPKLNADCLNSDKCSALCLAAMHGHSNCIIALCECFPAIEAGDALQDACKYNHSACILTLHQRFPQLTGNELNNSYLHSSALMRAALFNNPECIRVLHSCFPDIDPNLQDRHGNTALIAAAQHPENPDCIPVLFECFPNIDPNKQDRNGNIALLNIMKQGFSQSITLLATYFPSTDVNMRDRQGKTALMLAIEHNCDEKCIVALCESFPNLDPHAQTQLGQTALMFAVCRDDPEPIISQLHKFFPDIDPNVQNQSGWAALILAACHHNPGPIISQLRKLFPNIDPNKQEQDQNTALMRLLKSYYCSVESVRQFLDTFPNVDVKIQNVQGATALTLAIDQDNAPTVAKEGKAPVVDFLLERFPDIISHTNSAGQTELMLATKKNNINLLSQVLKLIAQMQ